jgi:protein-L-isoaspartate(D-aspartate) O-methyltransferase
MTVGEVQLAQAEKAIADAGVARRAMIDSQLRVSGVNDPAVLAAFAAVAREDFVPDARRPVAYADRAVPLDAGRMLAPALTYGQMLIAAEPVAADAVLVVGGGAGYLAALAAQLAESVTESDTGTGSFSLILVDGAVEVLPEALLARLADDGRVVTGLVERGVTRLAIGRKAGGAFALTTLGEADFARLPEFAAPKIWSF